MLSPIDPKPNFPKQEEETIKFWKENKIFSKQVKQRPAKDKYVFYDGPPFITGLPHYGHLLGSISKDLIPRYHAMKGKRVERVWGWDCHGLPIENKVEKALNLKNRRDIEKFGIGNFIDECYKYTREVSAEWDWYVDHVGRWADMDHAYRTMDQNYMESVIWVFKQLYEKGLVYEGIRTSLFCTRCGTPVSNFEIAMDNSYTDMEDPAITVKFKLKDHSFKIRAKNDQRATNNYQPIYVLAWTTTPWTMPSNRALVVDPEADYAIVKVQKTDIELEKAWLVKELPADIKKHKQSQITQAYLLNYNDTTGKKFNNARIRKVDNKYEFTVKYFAGNEEETGQLIEETKEITKDEYVELIKQADKKIVKTRYYYPLENGLTAEIDIYQNNLNGLQVVEVEFPNLKLEKEFKTPEWFGKEVTDSQGIYPPHVADKSIDEVNKINDEYTQKPHNFEEHLITDYVILAKPRIETVMAGLDYEIVEEFKGEKLVGLSYEAPYDFFPPNENDWKIYSYKGMVSMDDGVGIVHSAPGFGEIDSEMGLHYKLTTMFSVNDEGKFVPDVKPWAGVYVKTADPLIIADLKSRNLLFKSERIVHRYPFCYRCETPLIQKAQKSWFINIQKIKKNLFDSAEKINWVPDHVKEGRFKQGLETAPDWCISRSRYWGTPMPIWQKKDENGNVLKRIVIGSRDELMKYNDKITKIIFVRHGAFDGEDGLDGSLNEVGKEQAEELFKILKDEKVDAILSSSMKRCPETIEKLSKHWGVNIELDERFGSVERKKKVIEIKNKFGKVIDNDGNPQGAEEMEKAFLANDSETIKSVNEKYKGKTVVIVTHAEVIALMRKILEGGNTITYFKNHVSRGQIFTTYMHDGKLLDLHRNVIDNLILTVDNAEGETATSRMELKRVTETLDVWLDSASMPYAQKHYPFEHKEDVENNFPADYISEYIAQTRAWFYVMHVISTALWDSNSFNNCVVSGVIMGNDGRKMSKSYGNYPDPKGVISNYGGDALRLYLLSTPLLRGENVNVDENAIKGQLKDFLLPLWNSFVFLQTYADIHKWTPSQNHSSSNEMDNWILAKLNEFNDRVQTKLNAYDIPGATNELPEFLNEHLSKWYIRRSRDRFKDGDKDALQTLYVVIMKYMKILAPFAPFVSEVIYQNMKAESDPESVHLCDYPKVDETDSTNLLEGMHVVRTVSATGQSIRVENGLKVRQPLAKIEVAVGGKKNYLTDWMKEIIKDELNVKEVIEVADANSHTSGTGFFSNTDPKMNIKVTIDGNITNDLVDEGIYREMVRNIQAYRKQTGLQFGQMVEMEIHSTDAKILELIKKFNSEMATAVNATKIEIKENDGVEVKVNDSAMKVKIG